MKRQITIVTLLLLVTATIFSCKKDTESVKARIMGKWTVNKIVVSGYTGESIIKNGTFTYGASTDYMDFKSNNDDVLELSLKGTKTIGDYTGTMDAFNIYLPEEGISYCTINVLKDKELQFTAKLDKTNVVKVYYLTR
ncbi:hypothetical protein [Pedobacter punctiformis]|uniref:Lipocalin-like domain-containing protein n=1 Tax=Pedobacter punctiformis TaxID=3004097 RepID=A0ABT4L5Q4_9SPHI|nr:hypothetical protein [Pedobacter sp. HCMS5-2]MCZ4242493.1 hypothetical protein [Pedobacter sp. HCMS5-2]